MGCVPLLYRIFALTLLSSLQYLEIERKGKLNVMEAKKY